MPASPQVLRTTQSAASEKREQLSLFGRLANTVAHWSGRPGTFLLCCLIIVVWAVTGPIFHYSDTWQLIINTGTTIVTFLMVFLIQNTQNRDGAALQAKLDELIHVTKAARNDLVGIERKPETALQEIREEVAEKVAEEANHTASPAQPQNVRP